MPLPLLLLLGALTAIAPMSTDMYLPALPAISSALALAEQGERAGLASALHVSLTFCMGMCASLLVVIFSFTLGGRVLYYLLAAPQRRHQWVMPHE